MQTQTIIITGCSSGLGYALAIDLAKPKTNLVLTARNVEALKELEIKCKNKGADTLVVKTDVSVEKDCKNLIDKTLNKFRSIDILINNAGIGMHCNFEDVENLEIFHRLMDTNYMGTVYCTYYALPSLKKQKGLIVGISSLQGKIGCPASSGYSGSKFAMQGFLDSLRIELLDSGVDVLVASPGAMDTDINNKLLNKNGDVTNNHKSYKEKGVMDIQKCVRLITKAIKNRDRELLFTTSDKFIPWAKLLFPRMIDKAIRKEINRFYS
jgi:short-subunit dehydrogenase